jgi:putative transposase
MLLTFRYRLLPTKRQHRALEAILESQRQLYNAGLEERLDAYRKSGITKSFFDQSSALTDWRREDPDASLLPVALQRWTLKRVDDAYRGFFRRLKTRGKPGFPRFRGRGRFDTFGFRQLWGIRFERGRIQFKGMPGTLRVHVHRPMPAGATIRNCVFRRDDKGWTVGLMVDTPMAPPRRDDPAIGIDLGITTFAVLSDGGIIPGLKAARRAERRLRVANRSLARKAPGSGGRRRARIRVIRCQAATARARANHLHQASARLVRDFGVIAVERISVKGLAQGAFAKDIRDASWARFLSMLRYKAECAGSRLIEVDPRGTTQECSGCGRETPKALGDRRHDCKHCGLVVDRDLNAARNILKRAGVGPGSRNVADHGMRAGGNLDAVPQ